MAYEQLKQDIAAYVKQNGEGAITGDGLQAILIEMVNSLGTGYEYMGVATPSTSAGTPSSNVFYLGGAGTYANFGTTFTVPNGSLAVIYYDTTWHNSIIRTDSDAFFNVNQYLGTPSTTYTKANGRNAVPSALRSKGMIITYLTTDGWIIEQNLSTSGTWNADANWQTIGPVSVSQNSQTGHTDIHIGGNDYPVASVEEVSQLGQDLDFYETAKIPFELNNILNQSKFWKNHYVAYLNGVITGAQQLSSTLCILVPITQGESYSFLLDRTNNDLTWITLNADLETVGVHNDWVCGISKKDQLLDLTNCSVTNNVCSFTAPISGYLCVTLDLRPTVNSYSKFFDIWEGIGERPESYLWEIKRTDIQKIPSYLKRVDVLEDYAINNNYLTDMYAYDISVPTSSATLIGMNALVPSNDLPLGGILKSWIFDVPFNASGTAKIQLFRKIRTDGIVTSLSPVSELIDITIHQGDTIIDLSGLKIFFEKDFCFAFQANNSLFTNLKYATSIGYPLFVNGASASLTLAFNYNIILEYDAKYTEFSNKKLVLMGDSITWMGDNGYKERGWQTYFKKELKFGSIVNYARSGATWSNTPDTVYDIVENTGSTTDDNVIYNQMNRLLNDINNGASIPDYIMILAGTNDTASWRPDALSDNASDIFEDVSTDYRTSHPINTCTSLAKAIRFVAEMIVENCPNTQIIVATPLQATNYTANYGSSVAKIIEDCAAYMSWPCINQSKCAGISRLEEVRKGNYMTADGLHPSVNGAKAVGYFLASKVRSIIRSNFLDIL